MANQEHLDQLELGVDAWNKWREEHPEIHPDLIEANLKGADLSNAILSGADLSEAYLVRINLRGADLSNADLSKANLTRADLSNAILSEAELHEATLRGADLSRATLRGASLARSDLREATLNGANLSNADLNNATLERAMLVETNLMQANLTQCAIYGISVWNVQLEGAKHDNLVITQEGEPTIIVDNLKIAQFIYLLLNNQEIRDVIDTSAKKAVLILGRFTAERKTDLDALREALRTQGYVPVLFDFEKPGGRNVTETVRTLAHLARFIIADLTDPSSIPQELYAIVPTLAVPVQPVLLEGKKENAMLIELLRTYHWMLPVHYYKDQDDLLATLKEGVIEPAEQMAKELEKR